MMMLLPSSTTTPCSPTFSSASPRILPTVVAPDRDEDGFIASHDVHPHDVLLLPSSSSSTHQAMLKKHAGNHHYRMLVRENLDRHHQLSATPRHQQLLCRSIVLAVRAQCPPGRFMVPAKNCEDGESDGLLWISVDDAQATEATGGMFVEEERSRAGR